MYDISKKTSCKEQKSHLEKKKLIESIEQIQFIPILGTKEKLENTLLTIKTKKKMVQGKNSSTIVNFDANKNEKNLFSSRTQNINEKTQVLLNLTEKEQELLSFIVDLMYFIVNNKLFLRKKHTEMHNQSTIKSLKMCLPNMSSNSTSRKNIDQQINFDYLQKNLQYLMNK